MREPLPSAVGIEPLEPRALLSGVAVIKLLDNTGTLRVRGNEARSNSIVLSVNGGNLSVEITSDAGSVSNLFALQVVKKIHVVGGADDDTIRLDFSTTAMDRLNETWVRAREGNDSVTVREDGGPKHSRIDGGGGDDMITGGAGDDRIVGRGGNDILNGGLGDDVLLGRGGDDTLVGGGGKDLLLGDAGRDTLQGANQGITTDDDTGDSLIGGEGFDTIFFSPEDAIRPGEKSNDIFVDRPPAAPSP